MSPVSNNDVLQPDTAIADETAERILDVALTLFLEFGYRRTTMETVARRLGVSRVTVYRYHADKAALFQAVMLREVQRESLQIEQRLATLSIEENPVVEGFVLAVRLARQHALIRRLIDTDPEWLVLHMTLQGGAMLQFAIAAASAFLHQPKFKHWLKTQDLNLAGEMFVRLLMSAILTPGGILTSDDDDELRRVASYLVQPLL
jgi:TetR/AcrR family transcriptional repressor of uid operon